MSNPYCTIQEIEIGGYEISLGTNKKYWLSGPDGDGMEMSGDTLEAFKELIAKFFKENM